MAWCLIVIGLPAGMHLFLYRRSDGNPGVYAKKSTKTRRRTVTRAAKSKKATTKSKIGGGSKYRNSLSSVSASATASMSLPSPSTPREIILVFDLDHTMYTYRDFKYSFTPNVPMDEYYSGFRRDPVLNNILESLPYRKYILTNASRSHSDKVTRILGVDHHIKRTLSVDMFKPYEIRKPHHHMYHTAEKLFQADPKRHDIYFFDDMPENLKTAHERGWKTVFINELQRPDKFSYIDYSFPTLIEALRTLFVN